MALTSACAPLALLDEDTGTTPENTEHTGELTTREADETTPGQTEGQDNGDQQDIPDVDASSLAVSYDFECLQIRQLTVPQIVEPAGVRLNFQVTDCDGDPAPALHADNFRVINDEKGLPFGNGLEGGSMSGLGMPSSYALYSTVVIDLSDSIFGKIYRIHWYISESLRRSKVL